ncbi:MAG: hypothetical protein JWQ98_858 [Chlorobi bacterium]|nr:hypothetical protein [Chlorobiota bacterium]
MRVNSYDYILWNRPPYPARTEVIPKSHTNAFRAAVRRPSAALPFRATGRADIENNTRRTVVKHAGSKALDSIGELLEMIRAHAGLSEKTRGVFYRRSRAFLHFHEDPAGIFADIRPEDIWLRYPAGTAAERATLLGVIRGAMEPAGVDGPAMRRTKQRRTTS